MESKNWKLLSTEYINLKEDMEFECPEGHTVYLSYERARKNPICPLCDENPYKKVEITRQIPSKPEGVKRVLALDQSTKLTGWSLYDDDKLVDYGTFKTGDAKDEIKRCSEVKSWILSMIEKTKPDIIGLEGIQYQKNIGVVVFETLAELKGILRNALFERNILVIVCPTNTWRAHCGVKGKTRAEKKTFMKQLVKQWYDVSVSDDEADAIGIGKYVADTAVVRKKVIKWT